MSSSSEGAMHNKLAQHRQLSRCCLLRCNLSENERPCAKTQGDESSDQTAYPVIVLPISVLMFVPTFLRIC